MEFLHVKIEISGIKLEVIGNYWPGEDATYDNPGQPECIEIDQVLTAEGSDIGSLIADNAELQEQVETAALAQFKDGQLWARAERAVMAREESKWAA